MRTSQHRGFKYVPALDGLRALSVVAILLYHSPFLWAKGGFLGVSVFFTLSGFLITSLLLSERDRTGSISLKGFWVRRARRLAPAVLVLFSLVAVLLAKGGLSKGSSIFGDAVATAGWAANWRFILHGETYADVFGQPSPFQHMWSLAVEEQFYLLFPAVLLLVLGRKAANPRRWAAISLVVVGIATSTFLLWHLFDPMSTQRAYFGTDTRIAEPFVGVLLALLLTRGGGVQVLPRAARWALDAAAAGALAGLVYLVATWGQYDQGLYHGGLLLVAGLSAVVLAGITQPRSLMGTALSLPPLVWLGRISYGVYVFHWPVFLWLSPRRTGLDSYALLALRCAVVLLIAVASYALVEQPVREARRFRVVWALPAWANTTVASMAVLVLATGTVAAPAHSPTKSHQVSASGVVSSPLAGRTPGATAGRSPRSVLSSKAPAAQRTASAAGTPLGRTTYGPTPSSTTGGPTGGPTRGPSPTAKPDNRLRIAVVGDSMGRNLGGGMEAWSSGSTSVVARNFGENGCPLALGGTRKYPSGELVGIASQCSWFTTSTQKMKDFNAFNPQVVVLQDGMNELLERKDQDAFGDDDWHKAGEAYGVGQTSVPHTGTHSFDNWLVAQYEQVLALLDPNGTRQMIFLNAVCADWKNVPHFNGFAPELNLRTDALDSDYDKLTHPHLQIVDYKAHLCPRGQYSSTVDGVSDGRPDGYHLSAAAALAVATDWLGPICLDAVKQG